MYLAVGPMFHHLVSNDKVILCLKRFFLVVVIVAVVVLSSSSNGSNISDIFSSLVPQEVTAVQTAEGQ